MILKVSLGVLMVVAIFLSYVVTREGRFRYERSGVINAPAEKNFPYIRNLKMEAMWSPSEKIDPNIKKTFRGPDGQASSIMEFEGNSEVGSGRLEILKIVPNESVELKLTMTSAFHAENNVQYGLLPEGTGTRFT